MAKLVLSEGVSFMHGQGFAIACTHDNGGFAMHACMAKEGLLYMHGNGGFAMHAWHGGFVMYA